ncbi:hypothetical protein GO009_10905 [Muricauda sp. TY007]|uniref:hypothetical protein n=1 Tax=Allomuricauda sp. TY007 TaxID=2683200 RepID=UPI0013C1CADC|nr:hypothetical protein [Muricauda sp. TY007]NDV16535.1 hypothetical protein [Muricauda sp. TY007]
MPCDWENKHNKDKEGQPRHFYLKEKESGEEFPRAYYVKNPNKTDEENKKNSRRMEALMLKVTDNQTLDEATEKNSAVVLGEELPPPEKKTLEEGACPECGKKHVDIGKPEHWVTQKPGLCWHACEKILMNYGLPNGSGGKGDINYSNAIQVTEEVNGKLETKKAKEGIEYLDKQLDIGNPILVGIDHTIGLKRNEKTTDHFVVIVGRGCNKGKVFYTFYEVGTRHKHKGTSNLNKFKLNKDNTLKGSPIYSPNKKYTVSQVRKNK